MAFRQALRARATLTTDASERDRRHALRAAARRFLRHAAGQRCPPGSTDADYVLGLLRATGILCVYGSGFGTRPEDGFFRVVFLAPPAELGTIYDDIAGFTREYLRA